MPKTRPTRKPEGDRSARKAGRDQSVPEYCGFDCPQSEFPPADSAGLCRTMAAVYCKKLRKLVNKNGPCRWKRAT